MQSSLPGRKGFFLALCGEPAYCRDMVAPRPRLSCTFLWRALAIAGLATIVSCRPGAHEQWVHADLLRVKVFGQWHDVPLVPLADHLCSSDYELFRKHCAPRPPASKR